MRRFWIIAVAGVLVAGCSGDDGGRGTGPTTTEAPASEEATSDSPTLGPLVSGTSSIVDGTFVWTDYAYDDRGPDTERGDRTDPDAAGGDAVYGTGWRNEADLVQTQIGLDEDGQVTARVVLETLTDPSVPVVLLAFDTDADPGSGAIALGAAWAPNSDAAEGLGVDRLAVLREDGAELLTYEGGSFGDPEPLEVTVDAEANVLAATLPFTPDGETWTAFGAAGTSGGEGSGFDGDVTLHDLAFVGDEPEYRWQDDIQAEVLAGEEEVDLAMAEIDFGVLAEGGTELADPTSPGFHTYLYESALELGEGVAPAEEDGLEYRGPYQPYLVWIPDDGVEEGEPMTLFLHGLTQNHLGSVLSPDGSYLGTGRPLSEEIHQLGQYAQDGLDFPPQTLTVWPLARGEGLSYRGIAERDVLDVLADARERFVPDEDRIILSGASMGGIGAFRIGALYPDTFSVAAPLIGFATEDTDPLLDNFRNLPIRQINGAMDPLIEPFLAEATTDRLDDLALQYRAWMLDDRGHEAGGFVYDCVFASLPEFERVTEPASVSYTVDPAQFVSDPASGLELSYDGAYWVSSMAVADETAPGSIDASTSGDNEGYVIEHVDRRGESGPGGGDLCGPNPEVSTGDTWRERAVVWEPDYIPSIHGSVLRLELTNLAAVTVDVIRPELEDEALVEISSDTAGEVTLTGLGPGKPVTVGDEVVEVNGDGFLTITVTRGRTRAIYCPPGSEPGELLGRSRCHPAD